MKRLLIVLGLAAALAACGPQKAAETPAPQTDAGGGAQPAVAGPAAEVNLQDGVAVAGTRPGFVADYPGGVEPTSISAMENGKPGGVYSFTTGDPIDKVLAFYKARGEAAGLQPQTEVATGGSSVYAAHGPAGDMVVTAAPQTPGRNYVQITWAGGRG